MPGPSQRCPAPLGKDAARKPVQNHTEFVWNLATRGDGQAGSRARFATPERPLSVLTVPIHARGELALSLFNRGRRPLTPRTHQPQLAASFPTVVFPLSIPNGVIRPPRLRLSQGGATGPPGLQIRTLHNSGKPIAPERPRCSVCRDRSVLESGWQSLQRTCSVGLNRTPCMSRFVLP